MTYLVTRDAITKRRRVAAPMGPLPRSTRLFGLSPGNFHTYPAASAVGSLVYSSQLVPDLEARLENRSLLPQSLNVNVAKLRSTKEMYVQKRWLSGLSEQRPTLGAISLMHLGTGHRQVTGGFTAHSDIGTLTLSRLGKANNKDSAVSKATAASATAAGHSAVGLESGLRGIIQQVKDCMAGCEGLDNITVHPQRRRAPPGLSVCGENSNSQSVKVTTATPSMAATACAYLLRGEQQALLPVESNKAGRYNCQMEVPPIQLSTGLPAGAAQPPTYSAYALVNHFHGGGFLDHQPQRLVSQLTRRMMEQPILQDADGRATADALADVVLGLGARLLDADVTAYSNHNAQLPANLADRAWQLNRSQLLKFTYADPEIANIAVQGGVWIVGTPEAGLLRLRFLPTHLPEGPQHAALHDPLTFGLLLRPVQGQLGLLSPDDVTMVADRILAFHHAGDISIRQLATGFAQQRRHPLAPPPDASSEVTVVTPGGATRALSSFTAEELAHSMGCQHLHSNHYMALCDMARTAMGLFDLSKTRGLYIALANVNSLALLLQSCYVGKKANFVGALGVVINGAPWSFGLAFNQRQELLPSGHFFDRAIAGEPTKSKAAANLMGAALGMLRPVLAYCTEEITGDERRIAKCLAEAAYHSVRAPSYQPHAPEGDNIAADEAGMEDDVQFNLDNLDGFFFDDDEDAPAGDAVGATAAVGLAAAIGTAVGAVGAAVGAAAAGGVGELGDGAAAHDGNGANGGNDGTDDGTNSVDAAAAPLPVPADGANAAMALRPAPATGADAAEASQQAPANGANTAAALQPAAAVAGAVAAAGAAPPQKPLQKPPGLQSTMEPPQAGRPPMPTGGAGGSRPAGSGTAGGGRPLSDRNGDGSDTDMEDAGMAPQAQKPRLT